MYGNVYGKHPSQVPSKKFIGKCRIVIEIVGKTILAIKLSQYKSWDQIFFNATTCHQMNFQALIIGVLDGKNHLDTLVVSSCIFLTDDTAETTIDSLFEHSLVSVLCCMCMLHILSISLTYHMLFLCKSI